MIIFITERRSNPGNSTSSFSSVLSRTQRLLALRCIVPTWTFYINISAVFQDGSVFQSSGKYFSHPFHLGKLPTSRSLI